MKTIQDITNKVFTNDCNEELTTFPGECIDLVVSSPPYDLVRKYLDDWSLDFHELGKQLYRLCKPGGVVVIIIGDGTKNFAKSLTTAHLIVDWCDNVGFKLFEHCIYSRVGNPGAWWNKRFRVDHESILIFFKGDKPKTFDKSSLMIESKHAGKTFSGTDRMTDGSLKKIEPKVVNPFKCRGTIWHYATSNSEGNKLKLKHPATFSDKMAEDIIKCFSNPGDLVLDMFSGSGTTLVMAKKNNRHYIGSDISQTYVDIANERLKKEC